MYNTILVDKKNQSATITLNKPDKMNAIDVQMQDELLKALDELAGDSDVSVVIITGAGRAFCGGYDVDAVRATGGTVFRKHQIILRMVAYEKPVIAAVNGFALAEGFQIALASDIIIASEEAKFGAIGAQLGSICNYAVFALPRVVGRNRAAEMLFTSEHVGGKEAFKIGLANRVVPAAKLITAAREMAEHITDKAPLSLKYTKQALRKGEYVREDSDWWELVGAVLSQSADYKEGFAAFVEKRKPVFKGK